jgi:hypothetical protein
MAKTDYGYDDEDYGYGNGAPEDEYGYGEASPDDYGYGDATPDEPDYGYGDEDNPPPPVVKKPDEVTRKPKRRCSVTKFNLEQESVLTAADRIKEMRVQEENNDVPTTMTGPSDTSTKPFKSVEKDLEKVKPVKRSQSSDCCHPLEGSYSNNIDEDHSDNNATKEQQQGGRRAGRKKPDGKGVIGRMRKRLSLAF